MAQLSPEALQRIMAAAQRKGLSSSDVLTKAGQLGIQTPIIPKVTQSYGPTGIPIVPQAAQQGLQPGYALGRLKPTVATPEQPVIDKTFQTGLEYDPNNPEDYLMRLNARLSTTGKGPNEQEYYNALLAQKAMQAKQQEGGTPMDALLAKQQADYEIARAEEQGRDTTALEAYKKQLDIDYAEKIRQTEIQGQKEQQAAQRVYSFSGSGRGSAAAANMSEIQKSTNSAVNALNAAKEQAIALEEARLRGDDPEALASMQEGINTLRQKAMDWQIESIKSTESANQSSGATYMEAINNFMITASENGIDIGSAADIQKYATMARNADGSVNEEFIASLPEDIQTIIRSAAQTSGATEAPEMKNFGSTKYPDWRQWNGKERVSAGVGGGGGGGGGVGGGGGLGGGTLANEIVTRINRIKQSLVNNPTATRLAIATGMGDVGSDVAYLKKNLTLKNFLDVKKQGGTFGAMSEGEWKILTESAASITPTMSVSALNRELDRLLIKAGGTPTTVVPEKETNILTYSETKTYKEGDKVIMNGKTYQLTGGKFKEI